MDARRRTLTVDGQAGNAFHPYSSIPVPSSATKRGPQRHGSQTSRLSTAPSFGIQPRMSLMPGVATVQGPSYGPQELPTMRRSVMGSNRLGDPLPTPSGSRGDGGMYGRTPQAVRSLANTRRSSVFAPTGGRASIAPSHGSHFVKDTRPVRDRNFQLECQKTIQEYLVQCKAQLVLTPKWLSSPTQRDFHTVFRFLAEKLTGAAFPWGKKFEDDCIAILRDLRYPSMEMVGKTALTAPGSPNAWANLLAMLNWMADLCKAQDFWQDTGILSDTLVATADQLSLGSIHVEERLLWDFASKTYKEWFDGGGEVEYPQAKRDLEESFDQMAAASVQESERLEGEINQRDIELRQLQALVSPLHEIEEKCAQLVSDKTKFIAFIELHRQKADKLNSGNQNAQAAVTEHIRGIAVATRELREVEAVVSSQNLSRDEVNRMNHERESLARNLEELRSRIQEASQQACDQEMAVTHSMDNLEQLVQDYTALGHQIGTLAPGSDIHPKEVLSTNFYIDLEFGASLGQIQEQGRSAVMTIRPALQQCCDHFRKKASASQDQAIALDDEHAVLIQDVEEQQEQLAQRTERLNVAHSSAEEAKQRFSAETSETNQTIKNLEAEVAAMTAASQRGVLATQSHLEGSRIAFKELRHKSALLQDRLVEQLMSHTGIVMKAKEHTADSLRGVRSFAEAK